MLTQAQATFDHIFPEWITPFVGGVLLFTFCGIIASDFERIEIKSDTLPPPPKDLALSGLRLRSDPKAKFLEDIADPAAEINGLREKVKVLEKENLGLADLVARVSRKRSEVQQAEFDQVSAEKVRLLKDKEQLASENANLVSAAEKTELRIKLYESRTARAEAKASDLASSSVISSLPVLRFQGSAMMGKSLVPKLADAFVKQGGQTTFSIIVCSDSDAEANVVAGKADVCMTTFQLRDKDRQQSWNTQHVGGGAIAFVGFFSNDIDGLTHDEIAHFLDGSVQEWPSRKQGPKSVFLHIPGLSASHEMRRLIANSGLFPTLKIGGNASLYSEDSGLRAITSQSNATAMIAESDLFRKLRRPGAENLWLAVGPVFQSQDQPSTAYTSLSDRFRILPVDGKLPGQSGYKYGFGLVLRHPQKAEGQLAAFLSFCGSAAGQKIVAEEGFRTN